MFLPTGSWRGGELTKGSFRAWEAAVWAGDSGAFFQPAALGEGNTWLAHQLELLGSHYNPQCSVGPSSYTFRVTHSHWLHYTNSYFVKSPSSIFGLEGSFPLNMTILGTKEIHRNIRNPSHEFLVPCVEGKSWISPDWLMSFSKLQPRLELCQFAQALLKTKNCKMESAFLH
jgi:hypothetical protein